jgi:hypothetical protein
MYGMFSIYANRNTQTGQLRIKLVLPLIWEQPQTGPTTLDMVSRNSLICDVS